MVNEVKTLELIGKKKFNKCLSFENNICYESCLCFFSARYYYEYGKKYIIAELDTDLFNVDSIKIGKIYDVKFYNDTVFYYGLTVITDVYSSDLTPNLKYNSIYDFKVLPEYKKRRKKRKKRKKYYGDPNITDEDVQRFLYESPRKIVQERYKRILSSMEKSNNKEGGKS